MLEIDILQDVLQGHYLEAYYGNVNIPKNPIQIELENEIR